jgi:O-antigen ligase
VNSQTSSTPIVKLELAIVGFLLFFYLGVDLPPIGITLLNLISYPCVGFLILLRWKHVLYAATQEIPLLLLHLFAIASIVWSAAPDVTENEIKALMRAALFGVYLAARFNLKELMKLVTITLATGVIASLIAVLVFPSYGIHSSGPLLGTWKGVFTFKNLFAYITATSALLFLLLLLNTRTQRKRMGLLLAISVALLLGSQGRTALASLIVTAALIPAYWIVMQHYKVRVIVFVTGILLVSAMIVAFVANLEFVVVDLLGKNLELNGRFPIWTLMIEKGQESPWLGYGFSGFWTSDASDIVFSLSWASLAREAGVRFNSHNGFLELFLQLGLIGLILFGISLLVLLGKTLYLLLRIKSLELFWVFQTTILMILLNVADSIAILSVGSLWSLYIAFAISISLQYNWIRHANLNLTAAQNFT